MTICAILPGFFERTQAYLKRNGCENRLSILCSVLSFALQILRPQRHRAGPGLLSWPVPGLSLQHLCSPSQPPLRLPPSFRCSIHDLHLMHGWGSAARSLESCTKKKLCFLAKKTCFHTCYTTPLFLALQSGTVTPIETGCCTAQQFAWLHEIQTAR